MGCLTVYPISVMFFWSLCRINKGYFKKSQNRNPLPSFEEKLRDVILTLNPLCQPIHCRYNSELINYWGDCKSSFIVSFITSLFPSYADNTTKSHKGFYQESQPWGIAGSKGGLSNEKIFSNKK